MLMMVNVDNITGDALPYVIDGIFSLGAKNVNACTAITKKGRLGYLFFIDSEPEFIDSIMEFLVREVGTLGVRILESHHRKYEYVFQLVRLRFAPLHAESTPLERIIAVKLVLDGERVISARAEYRDLEASVHQLQEAGRAISLAELRAMVELAALRRTRLQIGEVTVEIPTEDIDSGPSPFSEG